MSMCVCVQTGESGKGAMGEEILRKMVGEEKIEKKKKRMMRILDIPRQKGMEINLFVCEGHCCCQRLCCGMKLPAERFPV